METGICELNCVLESFGYFCQIIKFDPYNIESIPFQSWRVFETRCILTTDRPTVHLENSECSCLVVGRVFRVGGPSGWIYFRLNQIQDAAAH